MRNKDEIIVFEKNTDNGAPLLRIRDSKGIFAECNAQEDSLNVFNCIFEPEKDNSQKFDVYFAISHYYGDELNIYYSFNPYNLDKCLQDNSCAPSVLVTLERQVKHDNEQNYY